ncbi:unnamed protein product, partial [Lymnaea stagnalis]
NHLNEYFNLDQIRTWRRSLYGVRFLKYVPCAHDETLHANLVIRRRVLSGQISRVHKIRTYCLCRGFPACIRKMNCVFAILICLPVLALCQPNWLAIELALFRHFDSDNDGSLTLGEIRSYLNTFDTNSDGNISRQEYYVHIDAQYSHDPLTQSALRDLFDELDANNDNRLNNGDYTALYSLADTNGDNQVSAQEFHR